MGAASLRMIACRISMSLDLGGVLYSTSFSENLFYLKQKGCTLTHTHTRAREHTHAHTHTRTHAHEHASITVPSRAVAVSVFIGDPLATKFQMAALKVCLLNYGTVLLHQTHRCKVKHRRKKLSKISCALILRVTIVSQFQC